ncbi:MAG: H-NS histone family protein [Methylococcales bacterium]|nr:H-NS histone family protein [Methylococcales bacterium]
MKLSALNKMTTQDFVEIPLKDLQNIQITINDAITRRKEQDRNDIINKMTRIANESGFALEEILASSSKKTSTIRYRNPDNPTQGWSGRGRKPNWLLALVDSGRGIEEFEI